MAPNANARVVLLNGPPGVGKTTAGQALAGRATSGVCIAGDALQSFVVSEDEDHPSGLAYVAGAQLASLYVSAGFTLVVCEFVFGSGAHVWRFLDHYTGGAPVQMFTLWAPLVCCRARAPHADGLAESWAAIDSDSGMLGERIDATGEPLSVQARLAERIHADGGLLLAPRWSGSSGHAGV